MKSLVINTINKENLDSIKDQLTNDEINIVNNGENKTTIPTIDVVDEMISEVVDNVDVSKDQVNIGVENELGHNGNIVLGNNNEINDTDNIVIGKESEVESHGNVVIGIKNISENSTNSVSIGKEVKTNGNGTVAIGLSAETGANDSVAIGKDAKSIAEGAVQIGKGINEESHTLKFEDVLVVKDGNVIPPELTKIFSIWKVFSLDPNKKFEVTSDDIEFVEDHWEATGEYCTFENDEWVQHGEIDKIVWPEQFDKETLVLIDVETGFKAVREIVGYNTFKDEIIAAGTSQDIIDTAVAEARENTLDYFEHSTLREILGDRIGEIAEEVANLRETIISTIENQISTETNIQSEIDARVVNGAQISMSIDEDTTVAKSTSEWINDLSGVISVYHSEDTYEFTDLG